MEVTLMARDDQNNTLSRVGFMTMPTGKRAYFTHRNKYWYLKSIPTVARIYGVPLGTIYQSKILSGVIIEIDGVKFFDLSDEKTVLTLEVYKNNRRLGLNGTEVPVLQINSKTGDIIRKWASVSRAAKSLGIDKSGIWQCFQGRIKTYKGFKWEKWERKAGRVGTYEKSKT